MEPQNTTTAEAEDRARLFTTRRQWADWINNHGGITINRRPAVITGFLNDQATVRTAVAGGPELYYSWPQIETWARQPDRIRLITY